VPWRQSVAHAEHRDDRRGLRLPRDLNRPGA
jgi:hypothetical protein